MYHPERGLLLQRYCGSVSPVASGGGARVHLCPRAGGEDGSEGGREGGPSKIAARERKGWGKVVNGRGK